MRRATTVNCQASSDEKSASTVAAMKTIDQCRP